MRHLRYKSLLVIALVFGLGSIAYREDHRTPQADNPPAVTRTPQPAAWAGATQLKKFLSNLPAVAASHRATTTILPAVMLPPGEPAPAEIRAIFPSVTSAIKNWRNYRPDNYTVRAIPGQPDIDFHVEKIADEGRFTTWVGRSALPGESLVVVATQEGADAIVTSYEGQPVEFHIRGAKVTVFQNEGLSADECGLAGGPNPASYSGAGSSTGSVPVTVTANPDTTFWTLDGLDPTANLISRVACFYDADTLTFANHCAPDGNGASLIDSTYKARLESGNAALSNSGINVRWAYLGSALAPTATNTAAMDVWNEVKAAGATGDFMRKKATEWGATQVFFGYMNVTGNFGGYGDLPGHYSVGSWNRNYLLLAHELSHNFGLKHDRYTDNAITNPNNADYSFAINMVLDGRSGPIIGTIMSYADFTIPYFSNAGMVITSNLSAQFDSFAYFSNYQAYNPVLITGSPDNLYYGSPSAASADPSKIVQTGNIQPLGIAAGQPYAADASRLFRENAASTISSGWYVAPEITTQPQSAAVTTGQGFTVSVTTRGTGTTTYQWRKDTSLITGATNSSYSVASASASDAANYSVTVTTTDVLNVTTTLISNNATITVNAPGSTGGSSSSTSGGGGGGGSIDSLFGSALIAALYGRLLVFRKKRPAALQ